MLTHNMGNLPHETGRTCNIIYYSRYNLSCTFMLYYKAETLLNDAQINVTHSSTCVTPIWMPNGLTS